MSRRHSLDARHLLCPLPVIRVQDRVRTLAVGDLLEVVCTDPGALVDIPAWCRIFGHRLLATHRDGPEIRVVIEIGAATFDSQPPNPV